ncbi:MAG: cation transporter, partial [Acidobacteria bacterium]|nr:cation transporter [Acidobacteriota bacterium]
ALITLIVSWRLGKKATEALLDAVPAGLAERIERSLSGVEGVTAIDRVRARHAGNQYFVDANIAVERHTPLEHAKSVVEAARAAIHDLLPGADIMIHTEPRAAGFETLFDIVKAVAARRRLSVHDLIAYDNPSGVSIEFHLEVPEKLSLEAAHHMVSDLEAEIQREAPHITAITTHIENEGAQVRQLQLLPDEAAAWREPLVTVARTFPEVLDCHQVVVFGSSERPSVSCHCVFHGQMPIARVHEITSQIEGRFRQQYPQVFRVTIHPEPHTEIE